MNEINTNPQVRLILPFAAAPATPATSPEPRGPAPREEDTVEFSPAATALASAGRDDGIRFEKVARIRSEIQAGTYDVSGKLELVLDRILDDVLA
jgi:anti-sigma28 factor (negative regulator of flagellin synthesis)